MTDSHPFSISMDRTAAESPSKQQSRNNVSHSLPDIIQGGMGVGVSGWRLARAVSACDGLGVVSGTALDLILSRRLQQGDPGGHYRRALRAFPNSNMAERVLEKHFVANGRPDGSGFSHRKMVGLQPTFEQLELLIVASFAEVWLAREGQTGKIGINFLHKLQTTLLPSLFGSLMGGVDAVLIGAGIPMELPDLLDALCAGGHAVLPLHVRNGCRDQHQFLEFKPPESLSTINFPLRRPAFLPVISSSVLAKQLVKRSKGRINGFVVELPEAGGHNAPPRGELKLDSQGAPIYGPRDKVDLSVIRDLGLPFWIAGGSGNPERLEEARVAGAAGVQVGTLFALSDESGLRKDLKQAIIARCRDNTATVFQDPLASPTGFPFQVLQLTGTLSEAENYKRRARQCDLGYLREAYERPDGSLAWRCAAENPDDYMRKGGTLEATLGRKCLCNGLMANIGLPQVRDGAEEMPLVTCGSHLEDVQRLFRRLPTKVSYSASDVLAFIRGQTIGIS